MYWIYCPNNFLSSKYFNLYFKYFCLDEFNVSLFNIPFFDDSLIVFVEFVKVVPMILLTVDSTLVNKFDGFDKYSHQNFKWEKYCKHFYKLLYFLI